MKNDNYIKIKEQSEIDNFRIKVTSIIVKLHFGILYMKKFVQNIVINML